MRNRTAQQDDVASVIAQEKALSDALFLSIGDGAVATDERARISRVNQAALNLLGYDEDDLLGHWFPEAIPAYDESGKPVPNIDLAITRSFIAGHAITARYFYKKKDGSFLPASISVSPVILDDKPVGAIEVFRDITDELAVDRVKSEFLSLASHQLRTPATAVKNYIAMLRDGYAGDLNEAQHAYASKAYDNNERQLAIVSDLLLVATTESKSLVLRKAKTNLCDLVKEVVDQYAGVLKNKNQKLAVNLPSDETTLDVDPSYFKMVVDNLLSNASKYTPQGGDVAIGLSRRGNEIRLTVSDTGVGIAPSDMGKLFKKFTRIDNSLSSEVGGSGIGLYLLKQIVELHNGRISVKSRPGKGTTFTVSFSSASPKKRDDA
jgi:PAS domain S-box-containing protein